MQRRSPLSVLRPRSQGVQPEHNLNRLGRERPDRNRNDCVQQRRTAPLLCHCAWCAWPRFFLGKGVEGGRGERLQRQQRSNVGGRHPVCSEMRVRAAFKRRKQPLKLRVSRRHIVARDRGRCFNVSSSRTRRKGGDCERRGVRRSGKVKEVSFPSPLFPEAAVNIKHKRGQNGRNVRCNRDLKHGKERQR